MDDLHVREATSEDKEAVLNLHDNVFEGSDYLPVYYEHFIASTAITPFALLFENKIIGYMAAHIVDDGQTVVTRSARLNPDTEGRGFYGYMGKCIEDWAKSKMITTKAFTTSDANTNISKSSFQSVNTKIMSMQMLAYFMDADKLHHLSIKLPESELYEVTDSLLATYITSRDASQYLFPEGRAIVDYLPCKVIKSNIPFMKGQEDFTTRLSDVQIDGDCRTGLLSFGTVYPCKENTIFHCTLEVYGTDERSVHKHVMKHASVVQQKAVKAGIHGGTVRFLITGPKIIPSKAFDEAFAELNARRVTWKDFNLPKETYTEAFLWEKKL